MKLVDNDSLVIRPWSSQPYHSKRDSGNHHLHAIFAPSPLTNLPFFCIKLSVIELCWDSLLVMKTNYVIRYDTSPLLTYLVQPLCNGFTVFSRQAVNNAWKEYMPGCKKAIMSGGKDNQKKKQNKNQSLFPSRTRVSSARCFNKLCHILQDRSRFLSDFVNHVGSIERSLRESPWAARHSRAGTAMPCLKNCWVAKLQL